MSLQVVCVLIRIIVSIRKVDARIRTVKIVPAFHLSLTHKLFAVLYRFSRLFVLATAIFGSLARSAAIFYRFRAFTISHNFSFAEKVKSSCSDKNIMSRFFPFIRVFLYYLTRILVAFALPDTKSLILYLADAIITSVPIFTASFTYSNFALAPFAPAREAPLQ